MINESVRKFFFAYLNARKGVLQNHLLLNRLPVLLVKYEIIPNLLTRYLFLMIPNLLNQSLDNGKKYLLSNEFPDTLVLPVLQELKRCVRCQKELTPFMRNYRFFRPIGEGRQRKQKVCDHCLQIEIKNGNLKIVQLTIPKDGDPCLATHQVTDQLSNRTKKTRQKIFERYQTEDCYNLLIIKSLLDINPTISDRCERNYQVVFKIPGKEALLISVEQFYLLLFSLGDLPKKLTWLNFQRLSNQCRIGSTESIANIVHLLMTIEHKKLFTIPGTEEDFLKSFHWKMIRTVFDTPERSEAYQISGRANNANSEAPQI